MDYKVFYRKYRPKNFSELVGQDNIKEVLTNSIKFNKIAHAYIFTGPRGTGKTSTAKIFAKTLNCLDNKNGVSCDNCEMCKTYSDSADIIEIDAASNNGVEEIRTLRDSVKIAPYNSKYKVYIIDEVHMLSNSAWNAFLKTLEEPPSHVIFILATTEINKIPETVMSRCQRFDFTKIPKNDMFNHLKNICCIEKLDINDNALNELCKLSNGCLRDALSYLDKVSKFNKTIDEELIESNFGLINTDKFNKLYNLIKNSSFNEINLLMDDISSSGITPLNFVNDFINYLVDIIINNNVNYNEVEFIKLIINKLNNIVNNFNSIINPFILIKIELLTLNYFPGNNNVNISQKEKVKSIEKTDVEENNVENKNVSKESVNNDEYILKIKEIRINNSFVNASKELKSNFLINWKNFIDYLVLNNEYQLLGMVENVKVEVVSDKNVLFSSDNINESIIFNKNLNIIENKFYDFCNIKLCFINLYVDEWNVEKNKFINNKSKKYEYINEENINIVTESSSVAQNIAENIFGNDIIEIR